MTNEDPPRPSGLPESSTAPLFDTKDIYGKEINLDNLLNEYNGVLIDFFRVKW